MQFNINKYEQSKGEKNCTNDNSRIWTEKSEIIWLNMNQSSRRVYPKRTLQQNKFELKKNDVNASIQCDKYLISIVFQIVPSRSRHIHGDIQDQKVIFFSGFQMTKLRPDTFWFGNITSRNNLTIRRQKDFLVNSFSVDFFRRLLN